MAGGNVSPRQKMIGMMYLVLTALLALNVSKEILNAFVTVNDSLITTNSNFYDKNTGAYDKFKISYDQNPVKTKEWYDKAQTVRKQTDELIKYLNDMKAKVISKTEQLPLTQVIGKDKNKQDTVLGLAYTQSKDNRDIPTNVLGMSAPIKPVEASDKLDVINLKKNIAAYRDGMLALLPKDAQNSGLAKTIQSVFAMSDAKEHGITVSWEQNSFYDTPMVAVITILTKIQTDVRNVESDMVKYFYSQVDASSFKFNKLSAAVIANSNYVLKGDSFKASVFLAAFDTTQNPVISFGEKYTDNETYKVGGDTLDVKVEGGRGYLAIPSKKEGNFEWKGVIRLKNPQGIVVNYPTEVEYTVARPNLTVSADKMNVFYKGVDNPVSISVPGVPLDAIKPSIKPGKIKAVRGKKGQYIVQVKSGTKAVISVVATVNGEKTKMGKAEFRVKSVPDPKPYFAGMGPQDESVKKKNLTAAQGVIAKMENFDFDLKFTVTSFRLTVIIGGKPIEKKASSNRLSDDMKEMLKKIKPGQKVYIENIKAKGPDGSVRSLGSIALKVL